MMKTPMLILGSTLTLLSPPLHAMEDEGLLTGITIDQLEWRDTDNQHTLAWDGDVWLGNELNRLILRSEGEYRDHAAAEAEVQLLYSTAISAFWNAHAGWRGDLQPTPERHWLALGVNGLAPYFIDVDASLFLGEDERSALRITLEHELMLTQKLALVPEIELNAYGRNDPDTATGAGLADTSAGIRLRYEIRREIAPYVGVHYQKLVGNTARFAQAEGEDSHATEWVAGVHIWF